MWDTAKKSIKDITTYKMKAVLKAPTLSWDGDQQKREEKQKSYLLRITVFIMLTIFLSLIPVCLMLPSYFALVVDLALLVICAIVLILNRLELSLAARALLVLSFETALIMVILATTPSDRLSIQQYELFVLGELLAVSLLNAWSVVFVALYNSLFIAASLLYQSHTASFNQDLHTQFWLILLPPIVVQLLVACVSYLWITNVNASIKRAGIAEAMATEAQQRAEKQKADAEKHMLYLQKSVERIMYSHAMVMNSGGITQIPLVQYEPSLWPLINAFNSLQNRLQHTRQAEGELRQIKEAIYTLVELIRMGKFSFVQPVHTKTALDMLLNALYAEQKGHMHQDYSHAIVNLENILIKAQLSTSRNSGHGF